MSEYMYEGMFLLDSGRFASDPDGAAGGVLSILTRCGAKVVASRPWQEGKLCYPINSQRKGLYYLACFRMEGGQMGELNRLCGLNDTIMRQLVIRHPEVVFNAMVDALTSHDGTIHSPEQREAAAREGRPTGEPVPEGAADKDK